MMNTRESLKFRFVTVAFALFIGSAAYAGPIFVSGDGNIIPTSTSSGNGIFFNNLLGGGSTVAVQDNGLIPTWSSGISDYYNDQLGISSSVFSGIVSSSVLSGIDLLVSILPDDNFTADEANDIGNFLSSGGSLFLIGENGADLFDTARNSINDLLGQLGSSMSLGDVTVSNSTAVIAFSPFTVGMTDFSFIASSGVTTSGGTALISNTFGDVIIAYENLAVSVPEPTTLSLLGLGLLSLGFGRLGATRRKQMA
jgi:hypothetical protein